MKPILEISSVEEFNEVTRKGVTMVDFYADWCGPCKMLSPIIDGVSSDYAGTVKVCKANADKLQSIFLQEKVSVLPTIIIYKDGEPVHRSSGVKPKSKYSEVLDEHIDKDS